MGTGVGEAMLIGAAVGATAGGAGAALQGGDPLKGALTGGAMGAVGGGLGAGFGAAGGATAGGTSGATSGGFGGITAGSAGAGSGATFGSLGAGTGGTFGSLGAGTGALGGTAGGSLGAGSSVLAAGANPSLYGSGIGALGSGTAAGGAGIGAGTSMISPGTMSLAASNPGNFTGFAPQLSNTTLGLIGGSSALSGAMQAERNKFGVPTPEEYESSFDMSKFKRSEPTYAPGSVYTPEYRDYRTAAEGGIMKLANGGPVERMSQMNTAMNPQGGLYPQGMIDKTQYATPIQRPVSSELVMDAPAYEKSSPMLMAEGGITEILESAKAQGLSPEMYENIYGRGNKIIAMQKALKEGKMVPSANMAEGGISSLGSYSDGGRMLKGPGDGMSDSIPASIGGKQPARLADGEFVVPADVVSHLGNGSTDAGAKRLYGMMDKVRKARTGKKKQAPAVKAEKYMPV